MTLPVVTPEKILPVSTFYGPPAVTSVSVIGGQATVSWAPVDVRSDLMPGEGVPLYLVEIWTCKDGKPTFSVIGRNDTSASFPVDSSFGPSRAVLRLQFKEGVSKGQEIPLNQ
jgi:hypothetical protein